MAGTIVKLGYTNPLTDTFGAHPLLGSVIDLNDGVSFTLASPAGLELSAPPRSLLLAGNIRTQGEIATRAIVRHNRTVTARLIVGPAASSAALIAAIRNLLLWLAAPPQLPITLQYQPFNASTPLYLDVVGASHNLPADEGQWLRGQFEPLTISFITRPGLRDARVTLQNLVANAGFEQPTGGPAVTVFNDSFATANAYASQAGSAPTVAANVLTIPSGARVSFGSPIWGSVALWQVRWQWVSGLTAIFYLHYVDNNNWLRVSIGNGALTLAHKVAGVTSTLGSSAPALTTTNFYWLQITQFPSAPFEVADVQVALFNDAAGSIGGAVASGAVGPAPTADSNVAMSGQPQMEASGAALKLGGAFANVHTVSLFGPGGWVFASIGGTGTASGAWEQQTLGGAPFPTTSYPGGPVSSFGAARLDAPPAGTWDDNWRLYTGGTPTGTWAIPVRTAGDTLRVTAWTKSSGLSGSATISLFIREYDASGSLLRTGQAGATLTGPQASWTQVG
ncbi:MAG TPA: hypothetical protein VH591_09895 [Ktedonobacterales bacterium]|jgi:hypothetical protein